MTGLRVAGIGIGLFILGFIWALSLFVCLVMSRARGAIANLGIVTILAAGIVTLTLVLLPRGGDDKGATFIVYDNYVIGRTAMVIVSSIMVLFGLVLVTLYHVFDPQQARALKVTRW